MGGGGFMMEASPLLDDYVLRASGAAVPRTCFLPTASGDSDNVIARFYRAFSSKPCRPTHVELFRRNAALAEELLGADVIYVGGGNTANMLALWRLHGVDALLRQAWEAGVVLAGLSAGAVCWFDSGSTDSFGLPLRPLGNGLGFLQGSFCPHYDGEVTRRPVFHDLIQRQLLPAGYAADDGAALHFRGTELAGVVASRPNARAFRVELDADASAPPEVREHALPVTVLTHPDTTIAST